MEKPTQLNFLDLLKVRQASFEGPLALLLELIRKHRLEIHQVSLAEICGPYLEILGLMEQFDLEIVVEFLDLASTLVLIKSRALLPILEPLPEEEGLDPEEELKQRLILYQQNQQLAQLLGKIPLLGRDQFTRPESLAFAGEPDLEVLEGLTLFALLEAHLRVSSKVAYKKPHTVEAEGESLEEKINQLILDFSAEEYRRFSSLVAESAPISERVVTFLAILELTKFGALALTQVEQFSELYIYIKPMFAQIREKYFEIQES